MKITGGNLVIFDVIPFRCFDIESTLKRGHSIDRYVKQRLGPGRWRQMCCNMFARSFTASSLSGFWRYWNPGYGFILLIYCYQPLRQWCSHSIATILTFLACGFLLHDVFYIIPILLRDGIIAFPFVTMWFAIMAFGVVAAELIGINFTGLTKTARIPLHVGYLVSSFFITRFVDEAVTAFIRG